MPLTPQGPGSRTGLPQNTSELAALTGGTPAAFLLAVGTNISIKSVNGGANWSTTSPGIQAQDWGAVCWSPTIKKFVAVALNGTPNAAATSPDGKTWTLRNLGFDDCSAVCWGNGKFVAISGSTLGSNVGATSPNGIIWTPMVMATNHRWIDVKWNSILGLYIASNLFNGDCINTSPDGVNWTNRVVPAGAGGGILAITSNGRTICPNTNGGTCCASNDGINWPAQAISGVTLYSAAAHGQIVSTLFPGTAAGPFRSIDNGVTFAAANVLPVNSQFENMIYAPVARRFIAVAIGGVANQRAVYSTDDGANYLAGITPVGAVLRGLCEGG
jgi:hypothetical protein